LRRAGVVEQRAGRAGRDRRFVRAEGAQVLRAQVLRERARAGCSVEVPGRARPDRNLTTQARRLGAVHDEQFGRLESLERRASSAAGTSASASRPAARSSQATPARLPCTTHAASTH
jgi:hypothetical protein